MSTTRIKFVFRSAGPDSVFVEVEDEQGNSLSPEAFGGVVTSEDAKGFWSITLSAAVEPVPAGHPDELIDQVAKVAFTALMQQGDAEGLTPMSSRIARALADAGLLADPEHAVNFAIVCASADRRQARIDKALALLADTALMPMTIGDYQALKYDVRAALTGGAK
jgi:hypothetical protein